MIPEIGHFALILALAMALVQAAAPPLGARLGDSGLMALARPAAAAQFLFISAALGCLMHAFVVSDFSVVTVADNSHSAKPLLYKFTGTWGNHEGSMLLWVWILAVYGAAGGRLRAQPAAALPGTGAGRAGADWARLPGLPDRHLQPVPAPRSGTLRRARPQPAAAGSGASPSIRRCSISAMSDCRRPSPSPWRR